MPLRIAVIGAGLSGLSCASVLRRAGCFVDVFEATRAVGGRLATTRLGLSAFDNGAQYTTARDAKFQEYLEHLASIGYVKPWDPVVAMTDGRSGTSLQTWYVGMPGMSAVVRPLAEGVQVFTERRVHTISRERDGWVVWFDDETKRGSYAAIAVAVPAPQAQLLLGPLDEMAHSVSKVSMAPCWSLMLRLDAPTLPRFDVYSDMSQVIRWIGRDSSKPGRKRDKELVVVHASQAWSRETEDVEPEVIAEELWSEVCTLLGLPAHEPSQMQAHLWKYGLVDRPLGESYLFSAEEAVGVAGDWCAGRLSEHAYVSGQRLGKAIVSALT